MDKKTIAIGTDHAGFSLKAPLLRYLKEAGHSVLDFGTSSDASCDYPDFVRPAAEAVAAGKADYGIVLGGSGNGEAIVANKVPGVRCGLCWNEWSTEMTRAHNNANVIAMGGRVVDPEQAVTLLKIFLNTPFEGGRHATRVGKISAGEVK